MRHDPNKRFKNSLHSRARLFRAAAVRDVVVERDGGGFGGGRKESSKAFHDDDEASGFMGGFASTSVSEQASESRSRQLEPLSMGLASASLSSSPFLLRHQRAQSLSLPPPRRRGGLLPLLRRRRPIGRGGVARCVRKPHPPRAPEEGGSTLERGKSGGEERESEEEGVLESALETFSSPSPGSRTWPARAAGGGDDAVADVVDGAHLLEERLEGALDGTNPARLRVCSPPRPSHCRIPSLAASVRRRLPSTRESDRLRLVVPALGEAGQRR